MGSRALLSLIAASLSILATAGEVTVDVARNARLIRGPWWWHGVDGGPWVALATAGEPEHPLALPFDGHPVRVVATVSALAGDRDGASHVLAMHLPPGAIGTARFAVGGEPVHVTLSAPPAPHATARIALAGRQAWPDRRGLATLAKQLGGEPQLVLALGPGCAARLGTGGWENEMPVVVVSVADPDLAASTAGEDARWRNGLAWGVLGLPASAERDRADLALARDLSPWLVYLDAPAAWDPAVSVHGHSSPEAIAVLVADCQRLHVPLILSAGAAGLVSEPLVLEPGGVLAIAPGGVRVALPVPSPDDGLAQLPDQVALPLEQPLLTGLVASQERLELVMVRPDAADAVRLGWNRDASVDKDAATDATRRLADAEDLGKARADIDTLLWLTRRRLIETRLAPELVARLRDEGGAAGRALARRFAAATADDPSVATPPGDPDPLAQRDSMLWRLAHIHGNEALSWREPAATSQDPLILRALLANAAHDPERDAMPALRRRVELQATGELPIDPDPLDQQMLYRTVFDDVTASPTVLRPIAVGLKAKVGGLGLGPIERFLARHGEIRPADR